MAEHGFSLVEWTISMVLLAMLAAGGFMLFQVISNTSERSEAQTAMDEYAESIAQEIRSIGWSDCYATTDGGLLGYFQSTLNARMSPDPVANPDPLTPPAPTQDETGGNWQVQNPLIDNVHLGAGLSASTWVDVTSDNSALTGDCSNYFVARVTFVVRNYDPAATERPSIPIEVRRQVLVTRS
ncbi:MAG: prepilin-type N-terminal cleavage/methylation domain-containing protein [Acidimicrobiia bacterium]|nr:prepilin-type N-terminal cleavage/methylation domain-containing protein [Acidimicrobiia bacterium]